MTEFSVFFILGVAVCLVLFVYFKSKKQAISKSDLYKIRNNWKKIMQESDYNKSLLNADKLLDFILRLKGYKGSLGEKLKKSKSLFTHINHIWFAHKLRNKIAHEIDFHVSKRDYKLAISAFRKAFSDLGVNV